MSHRFSALTPRPPSTVNRQRALSKDTRNDRDKHHTATGKNRQFDLPRQLGISVKALVRGGRKALANLDQLDRLAPVSPAEIVHRIAKPLRV